MRKEPFGGSGSGDGPGWLIWFGTLIPCLGLAVLGGVFVAIGHGLALGVTAGITGLVVGQILSVALAVSINRGTTSAPESTDLRDLPADQRVGHGLGMRRKQRPAEAARDWVGAAAFLLAAPLATLLTAILVGSLLGR